jgi:hypothetical protein
MPIEPQSGVIAATLNIVEMIRLPPASRAFDHFPLRDPGAYAQALRRRPLADSQARAIRPMFTDRRFRFELHRRRSQFSDMAALSVSMFMSFRVLNLMQYPVTLALPSSFPLCPGKVFLALIPSR